MKICLAGTLALVESPQSLLESKYLLESFYSIQEWQIPYLKKAELFLLDSGAFTFLNNTKKGAGVNWDEYVDKYAEFITKHNIKHFFELDIDSVVGYERVKELTKKLEEKTQRQCIPVWHKKRGLGEWKRITQEYNYVAIGGNQNREGLKETPRRVAGYWAELLEGMDYTNEQIARKYGKTFEVHGNPLVVKRVENVFSHCEHHLALMYNMTVTVAYLPVETGQNTYRVIGLSKIPRIVDMCAKRLQLQEKLAQDIADCIEIATGSGDVYVNIVADHACVSARGAKNEGATDVTMLKGAFIDNAKLRDEVERKVK